MSYIMIGYRFLNVDIFYRILMFVGVLIMGLLINTKCRVINKSTGYYALLTLANLIVSLGYNKIGMTDGAIPEKYWYFLDFSLIAFGIIQSSHYILSFVQIVIAGLENYVLGFFGYYIVRYYLLQFLIAIALIIVAFFVIMIVADYTETTAAADFLANGLEGSFEEAMLFMDKIRDGDSGGILVLLIAIVVGLALTGYLFNW